MDRAGEPRKLMEAALTPGNARLVPPGDRGYINGLLINHTG